VVVKGQPAAMLEDAISVSSKVRATINALNASTVVLSAVQTPMSVCSVETISILVTKYAILAQAIA